MGVDMTNLESLFRFTTAFSVILSIISIIITILLFVLWVRFLASIPSELKRIADSLVSIKVYTKALYAMEKEKSEQDEEEDDDDDDDEEDDEEDTDDDN